MKNYTIQDLIDYECLPVAKNDLLKAIIKARLNGDYNWYFLYDLFISELYIEKYFKIDEYDKIELLNSYDAKIHEIVYSLLKFYNNMNEYGIYNNYLKSMGK